MCPLVNKSWRNFKLINFENINKNVEITSVLNGTVIVCLFFVGIRG